MATTKVDPVALEQLARRLGRLRGELRALERQVDHYASDAGQARLAERLRELTANWTDARAEVDAELETLASLASSAAQVYAQEERQLAAGFAGVSSGPGA